MEPKAQIGPNKKTDSGVSCLNLIGVMLLGRWSMDGGGLVLGSIQKKARAAVAGGRTHKKVDTVASVRAAMS